MTWSFVTIDLSNVWFLFEISLIKTISIMNIILLQIFIIKLFDIKVEEVIGYTFNLISDYSD